MRTVGIDVGGTNTDAVVLSDGTVERTAKTPTTADVTGGIITALRELKAADFAGRVDAVMIGTTHFTNALVQRRDLTRVAAIRIGLPASASLEPFIDWPEDLASIVRGATHMIEGGHEYDGRPIVPFDSAAMRTAAEQIVASGLRSAAIASVFSPLNPECEEEAAEILRRVSPEIDITLSHELGRIGLLERENAALLNAALRDLARWTVRAFEDALGACGIRAPLYLTQNDGTVARAEHAIAFPIHSFASGPTNSMRGAAFLSRIDNAMVIDVGGTTTDVGCLRNNFPREANNVVQICGVRTLFRMPDLLSTGLGGGTVVRGDPIRIGPESTGFKLVEEGLIFGGRTLTVTDVGVAAELIELGDRRKVAHLSRSYVAEIVKRVHAMIAESVDRMKPDACVLPLIAVGGGSFLVPDGIAGISKVVRVEHFPVANAVGAAIAQVSGESERVFRDVARERALAEAERLAREKAVQAGANPATLTMVDIEDLPLAYLPGNALRVRAKVIGDVG